MRIAVTGGSGLVGRWIVRQLAGAHEVINIDIAAPDASRGGDLVEHSATDVTDLPALCAAMRGADVVVHAAALPGPAFGTEREIIEINVEGTRNVALGAAREGVGRIVHISSDSVLGFVFSDGRTRPRYLPVDESHPLAPTEPYGRSKLLAETALRRASAPDSTVVCLRPPWVWVPEEYEKVRALTTDPDRWWDGLWAYVHGQDLAAAVLLAATTAVPRGFHAAYVAAPDNGTAVATRELVRKHYPEVSLDESLAEFGSLISSRRLEELLGFVPRMTWREFLAVE